MIKTAKSAESIEDTTTDSTSATLLQIMKTQISAAEKHSDQLEKLCSTVASLQNQNDANRKQFNRAQYSRVLKPTPRNAQRLNYAIFSRRAQQEGAEDRPTPRSQPERSAAIVHSVICRVTAPYADRYAADARKSVISPERVNRRVLRRQQQPDLG
jgi:hypothetical protein